MEVIGSFSVGSGVGVEETGTAVAGLATGLAAGLAWGIFKLDLELGFKGGGLTVGVAELGGRDLAGAWAEVVVVVEAGVLAVVLATMAREEAGPEAVAIEGFWAGGKKWYLVQWNLGYGFGYCKVVWHCGQVWVQRWPWYPLGLQHW